jgi:hypothetical protein
MPTVCHDNLRLQFRVELAIVMMAPNTLPISYLQPPTTGVKIDCPYAGQGAQQNLGNMLKTNSRYTHCSAHAAALRIPSFLLNLARRSR